MRREKRSVRAVWCALALVANGVGASAQQVRVVQQDGGQRTATERVPQEIHIEKERIMISPMPGGGGEPFQQENIILGQPGDNGITFISEMAFDGKTVKGAPYSADAVTETVMALADGNRITRTTTAKLYRDSEGRTRREQSLNGIGAWTASEDAPQTVFINDPVAGANYVLNTKTHTVDKVMKFSFVRTPNGASNSETAGGTSSSATAFSIQSVKPEIRGGVLNGKALKKVQPDYPAIAKAAGAQGSVEVQVTVDEQGKVISARAVSGHPLLQQAAVEAARQWTFSPTQLTGQAVKVAGTISFQFALSGKEGEAAQGATQPPAAQSWQLLGVGNAAQGELPPPPGGALLREHVLNVEKMPKYPETHESLGKQSIEGVQADGFRITITIPASAIGNERPIQIVSERWYSSELQTVVMTRHSDPRFGETTYRLTNISRTEPDHSLFEVPADYKVNSRGGIERHMMLKTPAPPQQ